LCIFAIALISIKLFVLYAKVNGKLCFVNKGAAKMTKSKRKKHTAKKSNKNRSNATEYVNHLLELHKIQGVLLTRLKKEI